MNLKDRLATQQIFLCRVGFLLLCLLPTVLLSVAIGRQGLAGNQQARREEWQRELSHRIGLTVKLESVSYPTFNLARLDGLQLLDLETNAPLVQVRVVEVVSVGNNFVIELAQPELLAGSLKRLQHSVLAKLLQEGSGELVRCELRASELLLPLASGPLSLHDVSFILEPKGAESSATGPQISGQFRLPAANSSQAVTHIALRRNRQLSPPQTSVEINSPAAALPCELLAEFYPPLSQLGTRAYFAGSWQFAETPDGPTGTLSGELGNLDLDRLISQQFSQKLSGLATVRVTQGSFTAGRLVEAQGSITAQDGHIGLQFLADAKSVLGLGPNLPPAEQGSRQTIRYQNLTIGFMLTADQLLLNGGTDPSGTGVLLASSRGILLQAAPDQRTPDPAVTIARLLVPQVSRQVPATQQTAALLDWLPLPSATGRSNSASDAPLPSSQPVNHVPTRLSPRTSRGSAAPIQER